MKSRQLGANGPRVSAVALGTMAMFGHVPLVDEWRRSRKAIASDWRGIALINRYDRYGSTGTREARRTRAARPADHVVLSTKVRAGRFRLPPDGARREPRLAGRARRRVLAPPGRSDHADRGDDGRDGGVRGRREGALRRAVGSGSGDDSPGARGAIPWPPCRANTRCGHAIWKRRCYRRRVRSASGSWHTVPWDAGSSEARFARWTILRRMTGGGRTHAFSLTTCDATSRSPTRSASWRRPEARPRANSRSRGCCPVGTTSSRCSGRAPASTRTPPPWT